MGSRVSTLSPYRGRCIEVFEALRHADGQLHQRELFLWRDAKLFFIDESTASQQVLVDAEVSAPFVFQRPVLPDSACSPAASCAASVQPSWSVPPAAPP